MPGVVPPAAGAGAADALSLTADAVRHAGDRHERLAEEHHLPALHQEQQADPVVLAGGSGLVIAAPKEHETRLDLQPKDSVCYHLPDLWHSPHLPQQLAKGDEKPSLRTDGAVAAGWWPVQWTGVSVVSWGSSKRQCVEGEPAGRGTLP